MSDAAVLPASNDQLGPPERLHPLYLLTGLGQAFRGAWGMLALGALFASQGRWWALIVMAILFAAFSIGALYLRWLKLEYRVGAHEIRIDSGWLSRTSRAIPFDRVTDVDLEQGPIQRLFGLARVKLETGASAGSTEEEGVLHTISLERAEALREHIRARRGQRGSVASQAAAESPALFAMDAGRVALAGLFNFSLAVIAGLFGASQTMGDALGFDPFERSFWLELLNRSEPLRTLVLTHQIVAVLGGTLLLILLGIGTGLVRTFLREYGFRLDRTETGFRRRRGLLTLTDVSIPAKRVQAAILTSGPVRRCFGWWALRLQSLAQDGGTGDHVVAPLAHEEEVALILASIGWRPPEPEGGWRQVSRAYVWSLALGLSPLLLLGAIVAGLFGIASAELRTSFPADAAMTAGFIGFVVPIGLLLSLILFRWLAWRRVAYSLDGDRLLIRTGWWRHRRNIVPTAKIQSIDIAESWWSRLFGICTLRLGVAGGSGFSDYHVPALTRAEAEALRADLL